MASPNGINYEQLSQAIEKTKEEFPELDKGPHKEVVRHTLAREHASPQKPAVSAPSPDQAVSDTASLPDYAADASEEARNAVNKLIALTFEKGIKKGLQEAKNQEPFIVDMYHDALVDKLTEELQQKNLL